MTSGLLFIYRGDTIRRNLLLMRSIFWGPMAVAIAGGLIVATVLTLLVLPVMYAVAYRVKE